MIIRLTTWEQIREQFTESEKDALNAAITGQAICPRGSIINVDLLSEELRAKLQAARSRVTNL